jgi:membrane-associated protein
MTEILNLILHLDQTVLAWSQTMGPWMYVVLFLIIFAETGLVVTPFLPGDSLLFTVGAITSLAGSPIDIFLLSPLLMAAALLGDNTNYALGKWLGPKVFSNDHSKIFNKKHFDQTQEFCAKYGPRAIIIGRFMPIVRTFVPFIAGIGTMTYRRFISMSVIGAVLWINIFLWAGHYFGNLPSVKSHFHLVIFAVIGLSVLPILIEAYKARRRA